MKPILYSAGETQFRSNGLGRLSEATKCLVTEERNGQYELEMDYPITGRHYKEIIEERIIAARHDDSDDIQPFRIYKITRPMNGIVTVSARHISYQLSKVAVMPFSADTCAAALSGMIANSAVFSSPIRHRSSSSVIVSDAMLSRLNLSNLEASVICIDFSVLPDPE